MAWLLVQGYVGGGAEEDTGPQVVPLPPPNTSVSPSFVNAGFHGPHPRLRVQEVEVVVGDLGHRLVALLEGRAFYKLAGRHVEGRRVDERRRVRIKYGERLG